MIAYYRRIGGVRWQRVEALAFDGHTLTLAGALPTSVMLTPRVWQVDGREYEQRRVECGPRWMVRLRERDDNQ